MNKFRVTCPYCNYKFDVPYPKYGVTDDIKTVQYTRDIGRFDPPCEDEWFSPDSWSRIGTDYLSFFNWERIGVLRIEKPDINIQYKVQGCPKCKYLFDIYANYTSGEKLESIWKHLFETNEKNEIKSYNGNSFITWAISSLYKKTKSRFFSIISIIVFAIILSLIPWLFFNLGENPFVHNPFFIFSLSQKIIISICLVFSLYYIDKYIRFIKETDKFKHLFAVIDKNSITHWRNYTLSRIIGVQDNTEKPRLSQIDVVVGTTSIFLLLISFIYSKFSLINAFIIILIIILSVLIIIGLSRIKSLKLKSILYKSGIILLPIFIGLLVYFLFINNKDEQSIWDYLNSIFDLFFWCFSMFIIGTEIWMALSITTYILKGISKLPMNLSPYNDFFNASTIRKLQNFSITFTLISFVTIIILLSNSIFFHNFDFLQSNKFYFSNQNWLSFYLLLVVGVLISFLGFGSNQNSYFYLVVIYLLGIFLFNNTYFKIYNIEISVCLIITGAFFTTIMTYQYYTTEMIIRNILSKKKEEAIQELIEQIDYYRKAIKILDMKTNNLSENFKVDSTKKIYLDNLESLLNILKEIKDVKIRKKYWGNIAKISTPMLTSIIINMIIAYIT